MSTDQDERHLEPTVNRLKRAREHGMVPFSPQLALAVQLVAGVLGMWFGLKLLAYQIGDITQRIWSESFVSDGVPQPHHFVSSIRGVSATVLCFGLALVGVAVASHFGQKGFVLPRRQLFDITGLSPFGRQQPRSWFERGIQTAIQGIQLLCLGGVIYWGLNSYWPYVVSLWETHEMDWSDRLSSSVFGLALVLSVTWLVLSLLDYGFQRYRIWLALRMTNEEAREEARMEEGHPDVRNRRRNFHARLHQRV